MKTKYKDTVNGYELEFNSKDVFKNKIILSILIKNGRQTIFRCLSSVFAQQTPYELGILLIDDSSDDNWHEAVQKYMHHPALVICRCDIGKICSVRNLAIFLAKNIFPEYQWFGRLDADDCLDNPYSVADTLSPVLCQNSKAKWILAGNSLCRDGIILERKNFPSTKLTTREGLLSATSGMSRGIPEAELPSCNLWLHRDMDVTYPSVPSAEDHWLVAFLLVHNGSSGIIRSDILYSCYTLGGKATNKARKSEHYLRSRELLHNSVLCWFNMPYNNDKEVVLGWGKEGIVYRKGNLIQKYFIATELANEHVSWLKLNLKSPHFPLTEWEYNGNCWVAAYSFQNMLALKEVSLKTIRKFIHYCLRHNIVCLNFALYNFGIVAGELFNFDIGKDIQPFKITYFRDMCARIYLLLILGYSDQELKKHTESFRDNEEKLKEINGFESFYKDMMISWTDSYQFGKEFKTVQINSKKFCNKVTLLIKSCAMDAFLIDIQLTHILSQLCSAHEFSEIILLIDSRTQGFLREYHKGNYDKVLETGQKLLAQKKITKLLISPIPEHSRLIIKELYCRWFDVQSEATHTEKGIPVFSQLWAFEQINTRYVLQSDADVLIARKNWDHDYLGDMLTAIQEKYVFCVGFNIPHYPGSQFKKYSASPGNFKPEVRLGLLDIKRLKDQRPFPNSVKKGFLTLSWYQSVHKYQKTHGWKSLRGGNPDTYYIHPPNQYKTDKDFMIQVMDLAEQNQVPPVQYEKWDIAGNKDDWIYPYRNEEIIVLIMGKDTGAKKIYRCIDSLYRQSFSEWGAIIVDDASTPEIQQLLRKLVSPFSEKITLVQRKYRLGKARNQWNLLPRICQNPESLIIVLDMDDSFAHENVLHRVYQKYKQGYEVILGGMFRPDKPLRRYIVRFDDVRKPDGGNVWIHLRSFRMSLFKHLEKQDVMIEGNWIEYCDDFAVMIPLVTKSHKNIMIEEYLCFHERSTPNADHIRRIKNKETDHIIQRNRIKSVRRPTRYHPNLNKIEIDITYLCNLKCIACDRSCTQAPEELHMPVQTIRDFLSQTEKAGHQWESVHILGGEPTLHPRFIEIINLLDTWFQKYSPSAELKVISNGYTQKTRKILSMIPRQWHHEKSFKDSDYIPYFEPFNIAPTDLPEWKYEDFSKGCWISQYCGIGLTPQGYFSCAVAGGIERIMKLGKGEQKLPDNERILQDMYSYYCCFCGHFLQDRHLQRKEREEVCYYKPSQISKSWKKAYKSWKQSMENTKYNA